MYKLIYNGIDILPKSNNLSWENDIDTLGIMLSFDSLYNVPVGAIISLYINNKEYTRGIIVDKTESVFAYSYLSHDYSFYLKNEVIKQFNTSASNAIVSLLNEFGIKNKIVSIPTRINKIYKDESIADIIEDILEQAEKDQGIKYIKEMQIDTVVIEKLEDMKITPKILIGKDITINSSIEDMRNKILITSGSGDNIGIITTAQNKASQMQYGILQEVEVLDDKDIAQSKSIAENLLIAKNRIFKEAIIPLLGVKDAETIKANRLIELNVDTKLKGWYRIKSASHELTNSKHTVNIELEW